MVSYCEHQRHQVCCAHVIVNILAVAWHIGTLVFLLLDTVHSEDEVIRVLCRNWESSSGKYYNKATCQRGGTHIHVDVRWRVIALMGGPIPMEVPVTVI